MKLKGLEVQGFKTFPDKTKLDFTTGITAVVGPNGSGKSNISDAIRWVLGEQSAKALRCSRMEDVIFNGTQQRKKTGYAQVTLSIDNADRTLPFDGDEVSVTRRYYRSGNSEYLINNTNVRLQDIHELFMDTGLGRDGYSMIGQGKIDAIVSTKGEDRREMFEEAAGISRFRYKKAEAERRLERTEENLVRLRDILSELEGRVGPLRIQSEKAKAYLTLAEEKRGLEIALWLKTLDRSSAQLKEQEDKLAVANAQYQAIEKALADVCAENEEIYLSQIGFGTKVEEKRTLITKAEENAAAARSEISVMKNDILHNEQTAARLDEQVKEFRKACEDITREIGVKKAFVEEIRKKLAEKNSEKQSIEKSLSSLRSDDSLSNERLDEINEIISDLTRKAADEKLSYMTSSASIDQLKERTEAVEDSIRAKKSQMSTLSGIISEYDDMLVEQDKKLAAKKQECDLGAGESARCQEKCEKLRSEYNGLEIQSRRLFEKAAMLEELERNLEGFAQSVKLIMKEVKGGRLTGIHGPVSRTIKTSSEYNIAIEIALGAAMQNIVTETDEDAKRAIAFLKSHNGGRATFLPMSTIRGRSLSESGLESCEGFVGIASDLCSCEECYRGILQNLLGRIVVARDLDCAAAIARRYSYRFKVVTLDGQVVNAGGSLTGGSLAKNTGLLGRASEIEKIRSDARSVKEQADRKNKESEQAQTELDEIQNRTELLRRELTKLSEDKIKIEAERKSRKAELDTVDLSYKDAVSERDDILSRLDELNKAMTEARRLYDRHIAEIASHKETVQVLSGSRSENLRKREELNEKLQESRIEILTLEKDIASAEGEIANAALRCSESERGALKSSEEAEALRAANKDILEKINSTENICLEQKKISDDLKAEIERLNEERMELEKRSGELRREEREKTSERERISGELARLEERRNNLQKQFDDINGKLWEEYELTRREAENVAAKVDDPGKAQRRLSELKQKIRALGSVNVAAIEEYKEVSERYEFMKAQTGDVERSKAELIGLISQLTKQMRDIFIERFREINENFSTTFVELFGGGKASLSLSDPENVLTTGIDISVEPPGKIVSHIELLSGGEKALVAIALYFAIMKVRPSPFCVMDEIEAALDDVNVYRFASYLRRMNKKTQFICITHRRGTMEEADVLYGVTMQDRGVSKLLSLEAPPRNMGTDS